MFFLLCKCRNVLTFKWKREIKSFQLKPQSLLLVSIGEGQEGGVGTVFAGRAWGSICQGDTCLVFQSAAALPQLKKYTLSS